MSHAVNLDVQVPEPTGDPSADNQYNVTVFGDAMGEPWNPGDTVSLGSSAEITSVTEGLSSGGVQDASRDAIDAPFRDGQGNWSVDAKLGRRRNDLRPSDFHHCW